jgi:hypothetical protein
LHLFLREWREAIVYFGRDISWWVNLSQYLWRGRLFDQIVEGMITWLNPKNMHVVVQENLQNLG